VVNQHDVLLIADEVISGFGRIGADFGCDVYGVEPDLMSVATGLTSGYLPLSGVMVGDKVWQVLEQGGGGRKQPPARGAPGDAPGPRRPGA